MKNPCEDINNPRRYWMDICHTCRAFDVCRRVEYGLEAGCKYTRHVPFSMEQIDGARLKDLRDICNLGCKLTPGTSNCIPYKYMRNGKAMKYKGPSRTTGCKIDHNPGEGAQYGCPLCIYSEDEMRERRRKYWDYEDRMLDGDKQSDE